MEDKNKIFSYIGMGAGALMLISVFLPFLSGMGTSLSLWSIPAPSRFLFIFLGLAVAALFVLNKKTELTYLAAGYGFFSSFQFIIAYEGLSDFSIGFYLMLLASISMFVAAYLYDESKGVALLDLSSIKIGANNGQAQPVQPQVQPVQPQVQPVQPQVQPVQPQVQPVQPQVQPVQPQVQPVQPQVQPVQPQVQPVQPQVQPVQPQVQPVQPQVQPVQSQNDFNNQNGNQAM